MRAWLRACVVCAGVAWSGVATAAPGADPRATYRLATQLEDRGDYDKALVSIEDGLAIAPSDLPLLGLKGTVLLKLRDYAGALAAYQAYLAAGAKGANRREAQKIVDSLRAVQSTFLEITLANGPAAIYLDSRAQGLLCTAAPSCNKAVLPGEYRVIAERAGFERWTGRITVESDRTAKLVVTLVEKPSPLTVRVVPPGARVTVDGADAPAMIAAGAHQVVVSLAGHADARLPAVAHEGKPVELDVALAPLVPIRVEPRAATLVLDGVPVAVASGTIAVAAGAHVLVARAPGFAERRVEIPADRPADYQLAIQLAAGPAGATRGTRRVVATSLLEVGGAALGAGVIFRTCGECDRTQSTVLFAAGGAAVATGAVLWLLDSRERRSPAIAIAPFAGDDRAGLTVAGRF